MGVDIYARVMVGLPEEEFAEMLDEEEDIEEWIDSLELDNELSCGYVHYDLDKFVGFVAYESDYWDALDVDIEEFGADIKRLARKFNDIFDKEPRIIVLPIYY